ncbi:MAG TPA: (d)CMP kinase [Xanthomonadales bacterium]|nr:(d)CMP kinase [Xanthomonadales bacterium]
MKKDNIPVITIDGPGGSGKGTVSARLAHRLGWHFLDSGALYRLVAVAALDRGISADHEAALGELAGQLDVHFNTEHGEMGAYLNGQSVSERLRSEAVSAFASRAAAVPSVRSALVDRQRAFLQPPGLVADGRDMGTVIFPQAEVKIFLTASARERARRRYKQLKEKGESVIFSRLFREIEKRDERDRTRLVAPLLPAADAAVIDSTDLSVEEVVQVIIKLLEKHRIV